MMIIGDLAEGTYLVSISDQEEIQTTQLIVL